MSKVKTNSLMHGDFLPLIIPCLMRKTYLKERNKKELEAFQGFFCQIIISLKLEYINNSMRESFHVNYYA